MKDVFLTKYEVRGIKNLSDWVSLSFYRNTFSHNANLAGYNVKGIYGENGAGKTGLITSVKILKELITDSDYLNNKFIQKKLDGLINKKIGYLEFYVEFYVGIGKRKRVYNYSIKVSKDALGKYYIEMESLSYRNAFSHSNVFTNIYMIEKGQIVQLIADEVLSGMIIENTKNLLRDSTMAVTYINRVFSDNPQSKDLLMIDIVVLYVFGHSLFVYLNSEDDHTEYVITEAIKLGEELDEFSLLDVLHSMHRTKESRICNLSPKLMSVPTEYYDEFSKQVLSLTEFLKKFKNQLVNITIEKTLDKDIYQCRLILNYEGYSVDAEYESTGIKKLVRIYSYLQKMANGEIVFIDELDSNLHDVYLCALLEYLMEYGQGQLCFTTHNIGPMDVLKRNKKSIDFLSSNGKIYPWVTNGNYSPSKLYREGMIEGSPFNIDSIDFIGVFDCEEDNG